MTVILGTVGHRAAVQAVAVDGALEAFALGDGGRIDLVAGSEDVSLDLIAQLVFAFELQLADTPALAKWPFRGLLIRSSFLSI